MRDYNENKTQTAQRVWDRIRKKEDYADFVEDLSRSIDNPERFETYFEVQECLDIYYEWKKTGVISI